MYIVEFFGRIFLSTLFLVEGIGKISMQEDVIMYMENYGIQFENVFDFYYEKAYLTELDNFKNYMFSFYNTFNLTKITPVRSKRNRTHIV